MYSVPKLADYSPEALDRAVTDLLAALHAEAGELKAESDWKAFRDRWMARKHGVLTQVNDTWLKAAPGPAKRDVGQRVNELKEKVARNVEEARLLATFAGLVPGAQERVIGNLQRRQLALERLDITLPGI